MPTALEALDAELNATTLALLGDTVTYTPAGGSPLTFAAIVDYSDEVELLAGSRVQGADCAVEVPVSVIAEPNGADRIALPKRPGTVFAPKQHLRDESGDNWLIALKTVPA